MTEKSPLYRTDNNSYLKKRYDEFKNKIEKELNITVTKTDEMNAMNWGKFTYVLHVIVKDNSYTNEEIEKYIKQFADAFNLNVIVFFKNKEILID